jgi:hypothetical protein
MGDYATSHDKCREAMGIEVSKGNVALVNHVEYVTVGICWIDRVDFVN